VVRARAEFAQAFARYGPNVQWPEQHPDVAVYIRAQNIQVRVQQAVRAAEALRIEQEQAAEEAAARAHELARQRTERDERLAARNATNTGNATAEGSQEEGVTILDGNNGVMPPQPGKAALICKLLCDEN
jgi:hypothetical protein